MGGGFVDKLHALRDPAAGFGAHPKADGALSSQLIDGALGHHAAAGDNADAVAQALHQIQLVGGEDDRHTCPGAVGEHRAHHVHRDGVEAGKRLVQDENVGVVDKRRGELDALLVAQGEVVELVAQALAETELLEQLGAALLGGFAVDAVQLGQENKLVQDLFLAVQAAFLGHVADAAAGVVVKRVPVEEHLARIGGEHTEGDAHRGGLAGAVGADEAVHLAVVDGKTHAVEGLDVAEALVQVLDFDSCHFSSSLRLKVMANPTMGSG